MFLITFYIFLFILVDISSGYTISVADLRNWQNSNTVMPDLPPLISLNSVQSITSTSSLPISTHIISTEQGGDSGSSSSSPSSSLSGRSRKNTGGRRPTKENGVGTLSQNPVTDLSCMDLLTPNSSVEFLHRFNNINYSKIKW